MKDLNTHFQKFKQLIDTYITYNHRQILESYFDLSKTTCNEFLSELKKINVDSVNMIDYQLIFLGINMDDYFEKEYNGINVYDEFFYFMEKFIDEIK